MDSQQSWISIVERYLEACYEDQRVSRESRLTSLQATILKEAGSELISKLYFARAQDRIDSLVSYPPTNTWVIIEEDENRVLVEIPVKAKDRNFSNHVPYVVTRILLTKPRGNWQIHDILEPCLGCNLNRRVRTSEAGKCFICRGTGKVLSDDEIPCKRCEGTGECPRCRAELVSGWRRASFLERKR